MDEELRRSSILFNQLRPDAAAWQQQSEDEDQSRKNVEIRKKAPITSIFFVEQTGSGEYAAKLREREEILAGIKGYRVNIVEQAGTSLKSLLVRSDPWAEASVGEEDACHVRLLKLDLT